MSRATDMTPEQQTPASVVERLEICARLGYAKAEQDTMREAAALIERLSAEREVMREALETELWWLKTVERLTNCRDTQTGAMGRITAIKAALTQGESRQTLPAAPTPADGGGE